MWTWVSTSWFGPLPTPSSTLEPLLDLSYFPELVLVPVLPQSKSIILSFHTPFWDKAVDKIDSEINYGIWKLDGFKFLIKTNHIYIILVGYIREISGRFLRTPQKFDWAAFRGPIRPPSKPPEVTSAFPFFFFMHTCIHSYIEDNAWDRCGGGFTNILT